MELVRVLRMNGGVGESSYANNSSVQQKVIMMTKPILEEAVSNLFDSKFPEKLAIADLGCSSGPNTFLVVSQVMEIVTNICNKLGNQQPEFQLLLNDLPQNDFNTIFRSLDTFQHKLTGLCSGLSCFVSGVPGSFYSRLFPSRTLHFVHSSCSLMWLSQVPEEVENNKGNIYLSRTSPESVVKAYYKQFRKDFSSFLKCRSDEIVTDGRMVLTIVGRKSEDPLSKECCYIWELLALALNDMVTDGLIEAAKVETFNIPQYLPSPFEIKCLVNEEGSFSVQRLEVCKIHWNAYGNVVQMIRAVAEPLLVSHFGEGVIDQVFERYGVVVSDRMSKEKTEFFYVTVSLKKISAV